MTEAHLNTRGLESLASEAKAKGFESCACDMCNQFTVKRTGSIVRCHTCGSEKRDGVLPVLPEGDALGAH